MCEARAIKIQRKEEAKTKQKTHARPGRRRTRPTLASVPVSQDYLVESVHVAASHTPDTTSQSVGA